MIKVCHGRTTDRTHCRPAGLGLARPADGRGRDLSRQRRERAGDCPGRRVDRHPRGGRAAGWRTRPLAGWASIGRLANINGEIAAALRSMPIADQAAIDRRLIELDGTPNKARLGGNATIAVSMAALHAAAAARGEPLWRVVAEGGRGHSADADDPDFWRRRACRPAGRHPGFPDRAGRRRLVRRGAGNGRARLSGRPARSWRIAAGCAASPMKAGGGRSSPRMQRRSTHWSRRSSAPTLAPGEEVGIAIDVAASQFYSRRPLSSRRRPRRARNRSIDRTAGRLVPALSDRLGRGSGGRGRRRGHARRSPPSSATRSRSSATIIS